MFKAIIHDLRKKNYKLNTFLAPYTRELLGIQCRICKKRFNYYSNVWIYKRWSSGDAGSIYIKNDIPICRDCFETVKAEFSKPPIKATLRTLCDHNTNNYRETRG